MKNTSRLIEHAFPLKQASLDSVHEKNVRHGHISTLHIWPARRPLAACRAALIATLLSDPGTPEERQKLCEKIGGKVVKKIERKKMPNGQIVERIKEETEGGILHWKRETENKDILDWFRQEIRRAYGGRAPRVLDPYVDALNAEFSIEYLADKRNPRWVTKPTVAYLWARTVKCKNCRATIPLLKTRWLCKKDKKRVLLMMESNTEKTGVVFSIDSDVPVKGRNPAQRREYDKRIGAGTMSRSGAKCPCCGTIMTTQDMKIEGRSNSIDNVPTAVVVDGPGGKEYRMQTPNEQQAATISEGLLEDSFVNIPFGIPNEKLPTADRHRAVGSQLPGYGLTTWQQLFTRRQLVALAKIIEATRSSFEVRRQYGYPDELCLVK